MGKVLEGIIEGKSQEQAMLDAGYSKSYSRNFYRIAQSRSWKELLEDLYPDEYVAEQLSSLMNARKLILYDFPTGTKDESIKKMFSVCGGECCYIGIYQDSKDYVVKRAVGWLYNAEILDRAMEMVYKLKGYLRED